MVPRIPKNSLHISREMCSVEHAIAFLSCSASLEWRGMATETLVTQISLLCLLAVLQQIHRGFKLEDYHWQVTHDGQGARIGSFGLHLYSHVLQIHTKQCSVRLNTMCYTTVMAEMQGTDLGKGQGLKKRPDSQTTLLAPEPLPLPPPPFL